MSRWVRLWVSGLAASAYVAGRLTAIASKGDVAGHPVDLDLVSTLTTTYILDQYIDSQGDPLATFEKLSAAVTSPIRLIRS